MIKKNELGFTLFEILTVLAIIGILLYIFIPSSDSVVNKSQTDVVESDMRLLKSSLQEHFIKHPGQPLTEERLKAYFGFDVKITKTVDDVTYFELLEKQDPWGGNYHLIYGQGEQTFFIIHSYGPNRKNDIEDGILKDGDIDVKDDILVIHYPR